jgi:hypothetical protein
MPPGHTDLLDGIYGKRREGLRTFGEFGSGKKRIIGAEVGERHYRKSGPNPVWGMERQLC